MIGRDGADIQRRLMRTVLVSVALSVGALDASAPAELFDESKPESPCFEVLPAASPVEVDGRLDEIAWSNALMIELPYEIDPGENVPAPVRTECLLTFDEDNLYVGVRAFDPAPGAIRAHYMDRDQAWDDDWILVELDTFSDQRRAFQFLVNPLGVQMDSVLNEVGSGASEVDSTWDGIWSSAGGTNADGYIVEISIPFTSLRFPRGGGVQRWGFQAMRHRPRRFSHFFRITPWDRNRDCTLCENVTLVGVSGAAPGRNLELDPTLTAHRTDARDELPHGSLESGEAQAEAGLSARWGVTPNLSVNAAVNPDFSQVEADAAQLDINTRFALFYPEKRPFFLEGADIFDTPLHAIYSRTVAEPRWGLKLTGKERYHAFSVLVTEDDRTNLVLPANQESRLVSLEQRAVTSVARYRADIGRRSTVGALVTDRRGGEYANRVFGPDALIQISAADKIRFQFLRSQTSYPEEVQAPEDRRKGPFDGLALSLSYRHEARDWRWWVGYEHLDGDFRADSGFIPRVDIRATTLGLRRVFWPDPSAGFSRIDLTLEGVRTTDQSGVMTDRSVAASGRINGPLQSSFSLGFTAKRELFDGFYYDWKTLQPEISIRPSGALTLSLVGTIGGAVDYTGSRPADIIRMNPAATCFVGTHLQLQLDHSFERLEVEGGRLYEANLARARLVYLFNVRTFVRAIIQYLDVDRNLTLETSPLDRSSRHFFTQLLFSYKVNPRTLLFVGYSDNRFGGDGVGLVQKDRTFFIKMGYAWLL